MSWVGKPNKAEGIRYKETHKQGVLMLKLLKYEEEVLPQGPMFEVIPVESKHTTSSNALEPTTHSGKAYKIVVIESMFMI